MVLMLLILLCTIHTMALMLITVTVEQYTLLLNNTHHGIDILLLSHNTYHGTDDTVTVTQYIPWY